MHETRIEITALPAFEDNYIWLLKRSGHGATTACAVVDPGDHEPVLAALEARGLTLRYILLTHHHWDHAGGVEQLLQHCDATVFGPADDRLGDWCRPCAEGDTVQLPELGLQFAVLDVPAHTRSHIVFHGHGLLFSGDTLFSIGCGRLFEGSPDDMQAAMDKLAQLDPATQVYCGHEYTQANCRFALQVEPDNAALRQRAAQVEQARADGAMTLPARLGDELAANPFLRTREPAVVARARKFQADAQPGAQVMGIIRAWKDRA